ncbi:MAG: small-conductance mechanosensitive ion channel [Chloroflexi bacterium]|nr:small-conductance mechanosensitive ion channel [Chloroflexota bacterium]
MSTVPVQDWSQALLTSVAAALALLLSAVPKILGFVVILIIGWIIASAIAAAVAAVLRGIRFNDLARRSGFADFVEQMGIRKDAAGVLADVVRWFIRLIVLVVAFDALGLPAVSQVLQQLLLWLPNLVVALVVLVLAGLAANALGSLVRGATAEAGLGNPDMLATIARVAVWGFAIVIAVNQVGIATELVNTLFTAIVGAVALALALAFGLGGRETAGRIVASWYEHGQETTPKLADAAQAAGQRVDTETSSART